MGAAQFPLTSPGLLVAEGKACQTFLSALVHHLGLEGRFAVLDFGGVEQLRGFMLGLVVDSGFPDVRAIGIVRDAETSADRAINKVAAALTASGLPAVAAHAELIEGPPRVGAFILPNGVDSGNLEALCAAAVSFPCRMPCVEGFLQCLTDGGLPVKNEHKSRVYAYIAASGSPDVNLGIAVRRGEFDLDHRTFEPLRIFISGLAEGL